MLGVLLAGALEPVDLTIDRAADIVGQIATGRLLAVLVDTAAALVVTELLPDGRELLAEEELALLALHPLPDLGADAVGDLVLGEHVARPLRGPLDARRHVDRFEELELLFGRQVAPRAEAVGERAGLGGRAEQLGQPTGTTALAEHRQHAPQLLAELRDPCRPIGVVWGLVDHLVGLDPQRRAGAGHPGPETGSVLAAQDRGRDPVRQLT